jgi:hypothetical protein
MKKALFVFLVSCFSFIQAQQSFPSITPYGLAQYRLRTEITNYQGNGKSGTSIDYFNRIAFYLGAAAKLNNQVSMQLQVGNDWVSTEDVNYLAGNPSNTKKGKSYPPFSVPYFSLAYVKYDPGIFHVSAGIIPLLSNGTLDLIERSLSTGSYNSAALISWAVGTNNSIIGAQIGMPVVKGDFKMGIDLFSTVVESRKQTAGDEKANTINEKPNRNPSSIMFVGDIPMSVGNITFTPQITGILNRLYNSKAEKGDHEIAGGLSAGVKLNKVNSIGFSTAYSMLSNGNSKIAAGATSDTAQSAVYDFRGYIAGVNGTFVAGPGAILCEVKYSLSEDKELTNAMSQYLFADLKYSWSINKYVSLMPRVRLFTTIYPESNPGLDYKNVIRPELIFTGKF